MCTSLRHIQVSPQDCNLVMLLTVNTKTFFPYLVLLFIVVPCTAPAMLYSVVSLLDLSNNPSQLRCSSEVSRVQRVLPASERKASGFS